MSKPDIVHEQMKRAFSRYGKATCKMCHVGHEQGMSTGAIAKQVGITFKQADAAIIAYTTHLKGESGELVLGDKAATMEDNNRASVAAAKKHEFVAVEPGSYVHRRLQPQERFTVLFNLYLQCLASTDSEDRALGNVYITGHTNLREYAARYLPKPMSVAAMFVYFRTKPNLIDCAFAWAKENPDHEIGARIMRQYDAVYN